MQECVKITSIPLFIQKQNVVKDSMKVSFMLM